MWRDEMDLGGQLRRTATPLGRLDGQRADFPLQTSSASSTPYGSPASPAPLPPPNRTRRPSPKSAGSARLPDKPALTRAESWESDAGRGRGGGGLGRRASLRRIEMMPPEEGEGPFSDPLRSDWGRSTSDVSSVPPLSPEIDPRRRGSAVSTSSALSSYSPHHTSFLSRPSGGGSSINTNRHSLSSFGGYTLNTNASMPLLAKQPTRESYAESSIDGRARATSGAGSGSGSGGAGPSRPPLSGTTRPSSSYSYSDASSVHSYPPKPRQRTWSTTGSSENGQAGEGGWGSWAREIERTGATREVKRERSRDSGHDPWPAVVATSYIHQPVARPAAAYQSSISNYSFPGPSTRTPPIPVNPLAPLRKRLARSLATTNTTGRRLHTEVQLLLELIDALEHCITSFSPSSEPHARTRASGDSNASSTLPLSSSTSSAAHPDDSSHASLAASTSSVSTANTTTTSASLPQAPPRASASKFSLADEVRLLVRELVELVPDAQRCLSSGAYGPLAQPGTSTKALLASLEYGGSGDEKGKEKEKEGDPKWWPRRLAADARALLEEAGLPIGTASTAWLLAERMLGEPDEGEGGKEGEGGALSSVPGATLDLDGVARARAGGGAGAGTGKWSESRREELLLQGKERWAAYRQRQRVLEQYEAEA
ncbi:hypothetical protein JCM8097_005153 [Rhodosporidiobolus ruineniae]